MKKIYVFLFGLFVFFLMGNVNAETINSISMNIYIDEFGDAHVTEIWDATPTEKTEYYHAYHHLGHSRITDFQVKDQYRTYTYKNWDINASFKEKANKYGINYVNGGVELCFGKSSYERHQYTMTYTITKFILQAQDADIVYWNLLDSINPGPKQVDIVIYADEPFEDTLDVWGYGNYGGLAYVNNGKIYLSSRGTLSSDEYMVALVKFPLGTFKTTNITNNDFAYYFNMAEEGSLHYSDNSGTFSNISDIIYVIFTLGLTIFIFAFGIFSAMKTPTCGTYKLKFAKTPDGKSSQKLPKDVNMFRDIPCNKDIFRAYWVARNYDLYKFETDFLGAIFLKWQKEGHIQINSENSSSKDVTITFHEEPTFSNIPLENELYKYIVEASKDGILEKKELEKWCKTHYSKILRWFEKVIDYESDILAEEGKLTKLGRKKYQVELSMMEEAIQMKGLREFFKTFKNMEDKKAIEVMLWEEYLMYAQIFGVAKEVMREFKRLYPEVITDYSYNSVMVIHDISHSGMYSATSARDAAVSAASSYSGGGGGFSSGGGGGGSFGGGGGGSR